MKRQRVYAKEESPVGIEEETGTVLLKEFYKTFFMLISAECEIYPAHKCQNANYFILTFIIA